MTTDTIISKDHAAALKRLEDDSEAPAIPFVSSSISYYDPRIDMNTVTVFPKQQ